MDIGNVIAAVVVLAVLGAVFGFILAVASKVFEVKKDPREEEILSHLAGANCGGCGFPGCAGCAQKEHLNWIAATYFFHELINAR